jgi:demethylmenaquinone methyltransferase/2-methoxy-6-polyprenyl-1,4-benzoquinol methylase
MMTMRLPFDHFGFIARFYDRLIRRREDDPLLPVVAAEPGQLVLDVGGGTGRIARSLLATGARVIVCDASFPMARQARAKGLPALVCDAARLPFASHCAERVLVVDAFHHFVHPSPQVVQPATARELLRTLAPGGRLVIEEPDVGRAWTWPIVLMEKLLLMGSRFLSPRRLVALFETAGARTVQATRNGFSAQLVFTSAA